MFLRRQWHRLHRSDMTRRIVYSAQEPAVPLYLQSLWGLNSSKVGLIYLAAVIPTLFCACLIVLIRANINRSIASPIAGWWADRKGTEWITVICFAASIPWWVLITIRSSLAFFIVMFAIESTYNTDRHTETLLIGIQVSSHQQWCLH